MCRGGTEQCAAAPTHTHHTRPLSARPRRACLPRRPRGPRGRANSERAVAAVHRVRQHVGARAALVATPRIRLSASRVVVVCSKIAISNCSKSKKCNTLTPSPVRLARRDCGAQHGSTHEAGLYTQARIHRTALHPRPTNAPLTPRLTTFPPRTAALSLILHHCAAHARILSRSPSDNGTAKGCGGERRTGEG